MDRQTDGQSDPYVSLCFAGDTKICSAIFKCIKMYLNIFGAFHITTTLIYCVYDVTKKKKLNTNVIVLHV